MRTINETKNNFADNRVSRDKEIPVSNEKKCDVRDSWEEAHKKRTEERRKNREICSDKMDLLLQVSWDIVMVLKKLSRSKSVEEAYKFLRMSGNCIVRYLEESCTPLYTYFVLYNHDEILVMLDTNTGFMVGCCDDVLCYSVRVDGEVAELVSAVESNYLMSEIHNENNVVIKRDDGTVAIAILRKAKSK